MLSGLAGFLADSGFATGAHVEGHTLVWFEVNGWHNALHLVVGSVGLVGFSRPRLARLFAIGWGATAAVLAAWGSLTSYPAFGLIPGGFGGEILHLFDASLGIVAWLASAPAGHMRRDYAYAHRSDQ